MTTTIHWEIPVHSIQLYWYYSFAMLTVWNMLSSLMARIMEYYWDDKKCYLWWDICLSALEDSIDLYWFTPKFSRLNFLSEKFTQWKSSRIQSCLLIENLLANYPSFRSFKNEPECSYKSERNFVSVSITLPTETIPFFQDCEITRLSLLKDGSVRKSHSMRTTNLKSICW